MNNTGTADEAGWYAIRIKGWLNARWAAWLDGVTLTRQNDGTTIIHGRLIDQSALHGLLAKVRDTGLPLISVTRIDADEGNTEPEDK